MIINTVCIKRDRESNNEIAWMLLDDDKMLYGNIIIEIKPGYDAEIPVDIISKFEASVIFDHKGGMPKIVVVCDSRNIMDLFEDLKRFYMRKES